MLKTVSAIALLALAGAAQAQIVVPSVPSNGGGLSSPVRALPRSIMMFYGASNFSGSALIDGISFRLADPINNPSVGAAWPAADINFSDYTVIVGRPSAGVLNAAGGAQFPSTGGTYTQWIDSPVTVRSGPLTIPAGSFPNNGPAAGFSLPINFQSSYNANGAGDGLIVWIQHSGFGGADNVFFDVASFTPGVADTIYSTTNLSSPEIFGDVPIARLNIVPAPGAMAVLGLGGLLAARRRR